MNMRDSNLDVSTGLLLLFYISMRDFQNMHMYSVFIAVLHFYACAFIGKFRLYYYPYLCSVKKSTGWVKSKTVMFKFCITELPYYKSFWLCISHRR